MSGDRELWMDLFRGVPGGEVRYAMSEGARRRAALIDGKRGENPTDKETNREMHSLFGLDRTVSRRPCRDGLRVIHEYIQSGRHCILPSEDVCALACDALDRDGDGAVDSGEFAAWVGGQPHVDGPSWRDRHWLAQYGGVVYVRWPKGARGLPGFGVFFEDGGGAWLDNPDWVLFPRCVRPETGPVYDVLPADIKIEPRSITATMTWLAEWILRLIKSVDSGVVVRSNEAEVRRAEMVLKNTRNPKKRRKAERVYRRTVYAFERPPQKAGGGGGRGTGAGVAKHRVRAHWHHYWVGPGHRGWEMGIKSNEDDTRRLVRKLVLGYERGSVTPDRTIVAVR